MSRVCRLTLPQLSEAPCILVVAKQSDGMSTFLNALREFEAERGADIFDFHKYTWNPRSDTRQAVMYADSDGGCYLQTATFSAPNDPTSPLKAVRVGFLPRELDGDVFRAAVGAADYVVVPRATAIEHLRKFPALRLDVATALPDKGYVVIRLRDERIFWFHLDPHV